MRFKEILEPKRPLFRKPGCKAQLGNVLFVQIIDSPFARSLNISVDIQSLKNVLQKSRKPTACDEAAFYVTAAVNICLVEIFCRSFASVGSIQTSGVKRNPI